MERHPCKSSNPCAKGGQKKIYGIIERKRPERKCKDPVKEQSNYLFAKGGGQYGNDNK